MSTEKWKHRHLIDLGKLTAEEITRILDIAAEYKERFASDKSETGELRGRVAAMVFFEPSTRTSNSFVLAARRMSAEVLNFSAASSSLKKGETRLDTVRNIEAMGVDIFVVRDSHAGEAEYLAGRVKPTTSVLNGGDGCHAHPTQALLDIFTLREKLGRIAGLHVGIIGDIAHSRVARSNIRGLVKLGARVSVFGPPTLMPPGIEAMGAEVAPSLKALVKSVDAVNVLRIQLERQGERVFPSLSEYTRLYGVDRSVLKRAKPDIVVMHPGPINRGVEISSEVADGPNSVILQQVTNGVFIRMACFKLCVCGGT